MKDAAFWINKLGLKKHPEGGYYRETYVATETIAREALPERFTGPRPLATAIYFLLAAGDKSHLHCLRSDELWHFHQGDSLALHVIHPDGRYEQIRLGPRLDQGDVLQAVIPASAWFGASLVRPDTFALVGCTVSPGFAFEDFELGRREALLEQFPEHQALIQSLTRSK